MNMCTYLHTIIKLGVKELYAYYLYNDRLLYNLELKIIHFFYATTVVITFISLTNTIAQVY